MCTSSKIVASFFLASFMLMQGIAQTDCDEKLIVVVIPSYNNQDWYMSNLDSVLSQNYSHFRVIYTDDCSPDGTGDLVEAYLAQNDTQGRVTLVKNSERSGALHNLYTMIHSCDDEAIIVTLDGDDRFPDEYVLKRLNDVYSSGDIWLTYGQFQMYPSGTVGWASAMPDYIVESNAFRDFQHLPTHLRTFYAWLFKKIKLQDLLYLGQFYTMTWDMAMMFPMIEMAGERHQFISDIMYIYNEVNSISDHRVSRQLQAYLAQVIRAEDRYQRLNEKPVMQQDCLEVKTDVIIFFNKQVELLEQFLVSLDFYVQGVDKIFVLYQIPRFELKSSFDDLKNRYPHVVFYHIDEHRGNFRQAFIEVYKNATAQFTLFSKADVAFSRMVNLHECIKCLGSTQAYAFYFKLNAYDGALRYQYLPMISMDNDSVAWNFSLAHDVWSCANSLDTVLHRKMDSLYSVMQGYFDLTPEGFEVVWANEGNLDRVGLCYHESHVKKIQ